MYLSVRLPISHGLWKETGMKMDDNTAVWSVVASVFFRGEIFLVVDYFVKTCLISVKREKKRSELSAPLP